MIVDAKHAPVVDKAKTNLTFAHKKKTETATIRKKLLQIKSTCPPRTKTIPLEQKPVANGTISISALSMSVRAVLTFPLLILWSYPRGTYYDNSKIPELQVGALFRGLSKMGGGGAVQRAYRVNGNLYDPDGKFIAKAHRGNFMPTSTT